MFFEPPYRIVAFYWPCRGRIVAVKRPYSGRIEAIPNVPFSRFTLIRVSTTLTPVVYNGSSQEPSTSRLGGRRTNHYATDPLLNLNLLK